MLLVAAQTMASRKGTEKHNRDNLLGLSELTCGAKKNPAAPQMAPPRAKPVQNPSRRGGGP